jgi:hypothetical protein
VTLSHVDYVCIGVHVCGGISGGKWVVEIVVRDVELGGGVELKKAVIHGGLILGVLVFGVFRFLLRWSGYGKFRGFCQG